MSQLDDGGGSYSYLPQCTGNAAEVLRIFRERVKELEKENQFKPDMVAFKQLKDKLKTHTGDRRVHGEIPDVPIGLKLRGRGEAAILGIHCNILSGIDALKETPCYAVCLSGGYVDDEDNLDDGSIIYTGSGGQKGGRQVTDQIENTSNLSLIMSCASNVKGAVPIRVLRGTFPDYFYDGLYYCTKFDKKASLDGPIIYQFTLKPVPGKSKPPPSAKRSFNPSDRKRKRKRKRLQNHTDAAGLPVSSSSKSKYSSVVPPPSSRRRMTSEQHQKERSQCNSSSQTKHRIKQEQESESEQSEESIPALAKKQNDPQTKCIIKKEQISDEESTAQQNKRNTLPPTKDSNIPTKQGSGTSSLMANNNVSQPKVTHRPIPRKKERNPFLLKAFMAKMTK